MNKYILYLKEDGEWNSSGDSLLAITQVESFSCVAREEVKGRK